MPRSRATPDLPLRIRRGSGPLPTQIVEQMRALVTSGGLRPGDPVPSTRSLAHRLGISRGSVSTAYDQLAGEGYLVADHGSTYITPDLPSPTTSEPPRIPGTSVVPRDGKSGDLPEIEFDIRPGTPDTSALTTTTWRAAWRSAAASPSLGYGAHGSAELRWRLTEYLRTMRSVTAAPEDVLVTAGARDGLRLLLTAFSRNLGRRLTVAVEDPGYPSLHRVPEALGHRVVPIPLDGQGLNPTYLPTGSVSASDGSARPDIVLVTPSHQYPLGASMPVARRLELIRWAREHEAILVEDDYDSELRYVGDPLPALAALDTKDAAGGGCVVTLGSFAKILTPGLGLGFVLMTPQIRDDLLSLKHDAGAPVSGIVQDAMTQYLAADGLRRHTARMRREYRRRRDLLAHVLAPGELPPETTVRPMDGGLHAVLELPADADEQALVDAARRQGVAVSGLSGYWNHGGKRPGLVVGFGGLSEARLHRALILLRGVLRSHH
ncbi:MocR-like pyridoxine biosynthesis transcription factor PdxR [Kocuria sp. HSID16901]|uniref:MocR-like pyridoxine biosynthesis transcription factor PdxR n=1 Tax=Kocuria sp. HSID16901 TaxID=2419505 RepID=UPI00065F7545|nr:PLP-dependent aminotransferase family protein [Kocuria sp. HSID16901]MCT1366944.1 PLP-dependent aminotransferase family protein [Rothia sp. p3-SID1597]RUQ20051.1 PLP-dependent aminotransferase family protein [Kocuria sp. HSID16901]